MKIQKILDSVIDYFLSNNEYDKFDSKSVRIHSNFTHFVFLNILIVFLSLFTFFIRLFLLSENSLGTLGVSAFIFLLSLVSLTAIKKFGKLEPFNTVYVVTFYLAYFVQFYFGLNHIMILPQFVFLLLIAFLLKGNRFGIISIFLQSLASFIFFNTSLIHSPNPTLFYNSLIVLSCVGFPLFVNNYYIDKLVDSSVRSEKEIYSKKIVSRLFHELLNPLTVASGFCEHLAESEEDQEKKKQQKLVLANIEQIEVFIKKINKYMDEKELSTVIEEKMKEVKLEDHLS